MGDAFGYIFVIFLGIPVVFLYNVLFSIIRSLGDSRTPVLYLLFCSLLNVALDLLFILVFKMGVTGAAWATVAAQGISMLLCVNYIRHCDALVLTRADWRADGQCFKTLMGMGVPMGLQYSITAIGCIIIQAAVNGLGSGYVASVAAGSKVNQLFCCPFDALGSTMITYGGQNVGARQAGSHWPGRKELRLHWVCICSHRLLHTVFLWRISGTDFCGRFGNGNHRQCGAVSEI